MEPSSKHLYIKPHSIVVVRTFANKLLSEVSNLPQMPASVDWGMQLADDTVCTVTTKVFMYVLYVFLMCRAVARFVHIACVIFGGVVQ
jgi:hypothetical protein